MGASNGAIGIFNTDTHECNSVFRLSDSASPIIFAKLLDKKGLPIQFQKTDTTEGPSGKGADSSDCELTFL